MNELSPEIFAERMTLIQIIENEIENFGNQELAAIAIMCEWRDLYGSEIRSEFKRLYSRYPIYQLAPLFRISMSTAYYWQAQMNLRKTRKMRKSTRKNDRRIVPLLDLETGIFYDFQYEAAMAHKIPFGSIAQNEWFSKRFLRWAEKSISIMSKL